jgi:thiamine pyrophosphokinase
LNKGKSLNKNNKRNFKITKINTGEVFYLCNKICYIVGAGENYGLDFHPYKDDCVIAVDGGYLYLKESGITPNFIIGDFDSLGETPPLDAITLPVEKDVTDMLAAIRLGIDNGYDAFYIYGGTGGRLEHTLANIELLHYLSDNHKKGFLIDRDTVLTTIKDTSIKLKNDRGYVSVFTLTDISFDVNITYYTVSFLSFL